MSKNDPSVPESSLSPEPGAGAGADAGNEGLREPVTPPEEQGRPAVKPDEPAPPKAAADRRIVHKSSTFEKVMPYAIGLAVLGFIVFSVISFQEEVGGIGRPGTVIDKRFIPMPETQYNVGSEGFKRKDIAGRYILEVRLNDGSRVYDVIVDEVQYSQYDVGDNYRVLPPEGMSWDEIDGTDQIYAGTKDEQRQQATAPQPATATQGQPSTEAAQATEDQPAAATAQ